MRNIIVQECFDSISIGKDHGAQWLSELEADQLAEYIKKNKLDETSFDWGRHSLRIINYVGYIQLPTVSIEILPKVKSESEDAGRKALLNMLLYSGYLNVNYSILATMKMENKNLFEIYGYLFAEKLKAEITLGLNYTYVLNEDNLSALRGKLIIKNHIKNVMYRNDKAHCHYDEFSANNHLNQVLKCAVRMLFNKIKSTKTLERLKYCLLSFDDVEDVAVGRVLRNPIHFDRTCQRYFHSYIMAKSFLDGYTSTTSVGNSYAFSILFKMNDLFELYISRLAAREFPNRVSLQDSKYKLLVNESSGRRTYQLKPDIVISESEIETVIVDTKWKYISDNYLRHGVNGEDYFQMYAYLTRYSSVKSVILLYPYNGEIEKGSGVILESYYLEVDINKKLKIYSISFENAELTRQEISKIVQEA